MFGRSAFGRVRFGGLLHRAVYTFGPLAASGTDDPSFDCHRLRYQYQLSSPVSQLPGSKLGQTWFDAAKTYKSHPDAHHVEARAKGLQELQRLAKDAAHLSRDVLDRVDAPPHCREMLAGYNLGFLEKVKEMINFKDVEVVNRVAAGARITGAVPVTNLWCEEPSAKRRVIAPEVLAARDDPFPLRTDKPALDDVLLEEAMKSFEEEIGTGRVIEVTEMVEGQTWTRGTAPQYSFVLVQERKNRIIVDERGRNGFSTRLEKIQLRGAELYAELAMLLRLDLTDLSYADWHGLFQDGKGDDHARFCAYLAKCKEVAAMTAADLEKLLEELQCAAGEVDSNGAQFKLDAAITALCAYICDAKGAYKQHPVRNFRDNVVGCWDLKAGKYRYFQLKYMSFGNVHSVYHWSAFAELFTHLFLHFGILANNFIDDFTALERVGTIESAKNFMLGVFGLAGVPMEVEKESLSSVVKLLGLEFSLGNSITIDASGKKRAKLCRLATDALTDLGASSTLSASKVRKLVGLNEFLTFSTKFRAGRHSYSYLYSGMNDERKLRAQLASESGLRRITAALKYIKDAAMSSPPLVLQPAYFVTRIQLYTDAASSEAKGHKLGGILFSKSGPLGFSVDVPPFWQAMAAAMNNPIVVYEALALYTAVLTWQEHLMGRRVVCHIDNRAVAGALVDGSSPTPQLQMLLSKISTAFTSIHCWPYYIYVNTKFNISDALTREELTRLCVSAFKIQVADRIDVPL
eukprot:g6899.t1